MCYSPVVTNLGNSLGKDEADGRAQTSLTTALTHFRQTDALHLLLDYDGTLVPLAERPELASPDDEIRALLAALSARQGVHTAIISGRSRETLERWLGDLSIELWAEHGFWHRTAPSGAWQAAQAVPPPWLDAIVAILRRFMDGTPGSHVEVKSASAAWHYRRVDGDLGRRRAHELLERLGEGVGRSFEVIEGHMVVEVRPRGVSKALAAGGLAGIDGGTVIAIGDDRTDEDVFRALPASSITIAVGKRPSSATFGVADYRDVRRLLRALM